MKNKSSSLPLLSIKFVTESHILWISLFSLNSTKHRYLNFNAMSKHSYVMIYTIVKKYFRLGRDCHKGINFTEYSEVKKNKHSKFHKMVTILHKQIVIHANHAN